MTTDCDDGSSTGEGLENAQLQNAVSQRLGHTGRRGLRRVNVVVDDRRVILSGTVTSYYLKQMAQETARQACPNLRVYNDLNVVQTRS